MITKKQAKIHADFVGRQARKGGRYLTRDIAMKSDLLKEAGKVLGPRRAFAVAMAGWHDEGRGSK